MNYANHNLRANLQEWKNRLYRSDYTMFANQLKFLLGRIENSKQLNGLLIDCIIKYPFPDEDIEDYLKERRTSNITGIEYKNDVEHAAYSFQMIKFLINKIGYDKFIYSGIFFTGSDDRKTNFIENYLTPILYYLHDKLDNSNSVTYLLEKYKRRSEWFTKEELRNIYYDAHKNFEQIFEDDLRLFLFDQGIEYPFSTPSSTSGRADIIGQIETSDPLVIEIKFLDKDKGYGKNRIISGFSQIVKYANDYNKDVGYLVIYNLDNSEVNFHFKEPSLIFPPSIYFNNKIFYFVVINLADITAASKSGKVSEIVITESDLVLNDTIV